ncbi:hypothetical protein B0T13DRAFT_480924 [Neurospora crassa]|nr:hypothetical protein B0T13DRAFT_480924 [Neurospora crassa]
MVTMTRADAPAVPGLQSHPLAPPQQHALQPQPVSFSSASARPLSSTFSQRLPPLAMSIGTAPLPGAPHLQRPPGLGQQQSSTRTLQGPSAQDWARHRDIIVDLYRQYPLKKVSDIMRSQYNFSASKRMYDKRFREWNVFKNVNSDEKDRHVRPGRFHGSTSPRRHGHASPAAQHDINNRDGVGETPPYTPPLLSPHERQRRSQRSTSPCTSLSITISSPSTKSIGTSPVPVHQQAMSPPITRSALSIADLIIETAPQPKQRSESPAESIETCPSPAFSSSTPGGQSCATPASSCAWSEDQNRDKDKQLVHTRLPNPQNLSNFKAQIRALAESPPPFIAPDSRTRTLDIITLSLRDYYDWQIRNVPDGITPDDFLGQGTADASQQYWSSIKNAIYLIKLSASSAQSDATQRPDLRAWPALSEAGRDAAAAMTSQPFDFLRNLFATLSPANVRARPELRTILLQFLASEANNNFSPTHPIARICTELNNDEDCQEISRRALQCMVDLFSRLGQRRFVSFKLLDSLATLLRRNGEFDAAMVIVTELFKACRQEFGPYAEQTRAVQNELAHFYMVVDDGDQALQHCMAVIRRPPPEGLANDPKIAFHQDGIAAHTMEDVAEIHEKRGDLDQAIVWLERAADVALRVWGPQAVATGHIIDKLTTVKKEYANNMLKSARDWEAIIER